MQKVAIGKASAGSGIVAGAIGSPAANAGAMGSSAVGAKIAQNVFGRPDRQPGGEYRRDGQPGGEFRRDGQLCSRM